MQEIRASGREGAISIELEYSPQPDLIVAWMTEAYEVTDRLMRAIGLCGGV